MKTVGNLRRIRFKAATNPARRLLRASYSLLRVARIVTRLGVGIDGGQAAVSHPPDPMTQAPGDLD